MCLELCAEFPLPCISCPCFSEIVTLTSCTFLVFNHRLVRILWKYLACLFLTKQINLQLDLSTVDEKSISLFHPTTPFSLFPSTVNSLVSRLFPTAEKSHQAFGKTPAVLGKLLCWWTECFQLHPFPLSFLAITSAHPHDHRHPSGFADPRPVSCTQSCTRGLQHQFRNWLELLCHR